MVQTKPKITDFEKACKKHGAYIDIDGFIRVDFPMYTYKVYFSRDGRRQRKKVKYRIYKQ